MLLTLFLTTIVLVALAFAGLGFNIFFTKKGKFPQTEIGSNKDMKKLGITCAKHDEMKKYRQEKKARQSVQPVNQPPLRDCGLGCSCASEEF